MKTVVANWSLPQPSQQYQITGQVFRAYLNSGLFLEDSSLSPTDTSKQFECADGELTCKVASICNGEESEPDSETTTVDGGTADGTINASIPAPYGMSLYVS